MTRPAGSSYAGPQLAIERALAAARGQCAVIAEELSTASLRWAGNTLTTNGVYTTRQLTVIAIGSRAGRAGGEGGASVGVLSGTGIRDDEIEDLVRAAERAAADSPAAADAAGLPAPATAATPAVPWAAPATRTGIGVLRDFTAALGETMRGAEAAGRQLYGLAEHKVTSTFIGTSTGLRVRNDQPAGRVELNARPAGRPGSVWAGVATRDFTGIDIAALDADLAKRLRWAARSTELKPGRYETLLLPPAVADLMINLYWRAGARGAAQGRTVFSRPGGGTRVGEQLCPLPLTLSSDPSAEDLRCAPFVIAHRSAPDASVFDNGLPLRRTDWIRDGTLTALVSSRHSAALAGLPATPTIGNLSLTTSAGDAPSLEEMVASTKKALLVTCVWYVRDLDPRRLLLTGLTRDGVYQVENGEITGAVNNFRFNESPVGMLSRLTEAGATTPTLPREWGGFNRVAMPPIRVEEFNMSSVSEVG